MRKLVVNLTIVIIVIHSVNGIQTAESLHEDEQSLKVDENVNSVKTKRGAYGYTSGLGLSLPAYGQGYTKYSPYARYPGIYKKAIGQSAYTITPGSAVTHSFNVNYPKVFVSNPVLRPTSILIHSKQIVPVAPISVYANSFPVLVRKPIVVQKPIVPIAPVPQFIPVIPPNIHVVNPIGVPSVLSQSTIIPHDEWRPIISSVHNSGHTAHINQPAVTVLPPLRPLHSTASTHIPNNYYLPPDNLPIHHDIGPHGVSLAGSQQHDLRAHLQHLQRIQEFQQHQNFLRSEQNDGVVTPLSEQGYETASNNGRYAGPSSYEVSLNSRGN